MKTQRAPIIASGTLNANGAALPARRTSILALILLILLLSLAVDVRVLPGDPALGQDYDDFYVAAVAQQQGLNPYDGGVLTVIEQRVFGRSSFSNTVASPPAFFVVFRPLTGLTPRQGYLLTLGLGVALLLLAMRDLGTMLGCKGDPWFWILALSPPTIIAAFLGQITLLLVACLIWGIRSLLSQKPSLAGFLLALTLVKPHLMLIPVALLCTLTWQHGGRRTALHALLWLAALSLLSVPFAEQHAFADWLRALTDYGSKFDRWQPDISSMAGIYLPYLPRPVGRALSILAVMVGIGYAAWVTGKGKRAAQTPGSAAWWQRWALGSTVWLALLPYIHPYDDMLLIIPLALMLALAKGRMLPTLTLVALLATVSLPELDLMGFRPNLTFSYTCVAVLVTAVALTGARGLDGAAPSAERVPQASRRTET